MEAHFHCSYSSASYLLNQLSIPESVTVADVFTPNDGCMGSPESTVTCVWPDLTVILVTNSNGDTEYRVTLADDGTTKTFTSGIEAALHCRANMLPPRTGWWPVDR